MKKNIFICFLMVGLLTGCGETVLRCTDRITDTADVKVDETVQLTYKGKKLVSGSIISDFRFADNIDANYDVVSADLEEQYSIYKKSKAVKYSAEKRKTGLSFNVKINPEKANEEEKKTFELVTKYVDYNYTEALTDLTNRGYKCNK